MSKVRVGITMGDPSGVGPTIILKAINKIKGAADFTIIGDKWVFDQLSRACRQAGVVPCLPAGRSCQLSGINFIDMNNVAHKNFSFGKIKAEYGRASVEYIDKALELIKNNRIDCLVTCPVSKEAINKAGIKFFGHTEYLAKKNNCKDFVMMLLNKYLKIGLVTWHIPLADVSKEIDGNKLSKTIRLIRNGLKELFLIKNPRIVVCGLNPHASDNGLMGKEENKIIKPALENLRGAVKYIAGPKSADVGLLELKEKKYDCAIVMYHDQALIALKILDASSGVNITLGLPFVRTSPLHGTAFDIAANYSCVNADSLIEAILLAQKCVLNQRKN